MRGKIFKKKVLSVIMTVTMMVSLFSSPVSAADVLEKEEGTFRFGVISDVHISAIGGKTYDTNYMARKFENAIEKLTAQNIDALALGGDIVNQVLSSNSDATSADHISADVYSFVKQSLENYAGDLYNYDDTENDKFVYAMGNHEFAAGLYDEEVSNLAIATFEEQMNMPSNSHEVINGYHFITASGYDYSIKFSEETMSWVMQEIEAAHTADADKPVFLILHGPVYDTTLGSTTEEFYSEEFKAFLNERPYIINITGHTHVPGQNPYTIWQEGFTAVQSGGVAASDIQTENMDLSLLTDKTTVSLEEAPQGLMIDVSADNIVTIRRIDFTTGEFIGVPYVIEIYDGCEEGFLYTSSREIASAPYFDENSGINVKRNTPTAAEITFPAAICDATALADGIVKAYRIKVANSVSGATVIDKTYLSDYYKVPTQRATSHTLEISGLAAGSSYDVEIYPINTYGVEGVALTGEIPGGSNIAYGKDAMFVLPGSNEEYVSPNATNADSLTDGNYENGIDAPLQWTWEAVIDLGDVYTVDTVKVYHATMNEAEIHHPVGVSMDGVNWEQVDYLKKGASLGFNYFDNASYPAYEYEAYFAPREARYIRIFDPVSHWGVGSIMSEVEVYSSAKEAGRNVAVGSDVFVYDYTGAQINVNTGRAATWMCDSKYDTPVAGVGTYRWSTQLTMPDTFVINSVRVSFTTHLTTTETKKVETYEIQISEDGEAYKSVGNLCADPTGTAGTVKFSPQKVKYIRVIDTVSANIREGCEIYEIEAFESPYGANIAIGKNAWFTKEGSNDEYNSFFEINATRATTLVDGDYSVGIAPPLVFNWETVIDLGDVYTVDTIKAYYASRSDAAVYHPVGVSMDGVNWEQVDYLKKGAAFGINYISNSPDFPAYEYKAAFEPREARYIKVFDPVDHWGTDVVMSEIEVYESKNPARVNVANSSEASVYGWTMNPLIIGGNKSATQITDGKYDIAVAAAYAYNYSTQLILDKVYLIDKVRVTFSDYLLSASLINAGTFEVWVSEDGESYKNVGNLKALDGTVCSVDFAPEATKYIRIVDTVYRNSDGYEIYEIEAFESLVPFKVVQYADGKETDMLKNGTVKAALKGNTLTSGMLVTAVYDKGGKLIAVSKTDIAEGTENVLDLSETAVGNITSKNLVLDETLTVTANMFYTDGERTQALNNSNGMPKYASYAIDGATGPVSSGDNYVLGSGSYQGLVRVDLGEVCVADGVRVHYKTSQENWEIRISENGTDWTTIGSGTEEIKNDYIELSFESTNVRYVDVVDNDNTKQQMVYEVEIFEPAEEYTLRTFVWDSEGLAPYMEAVTIVN